MKNRHATALSVVGWYLMVPQIYDQGNQWILGPWDNHQPDVSAWRKVGSYKTDAECKEAIEVHKHLAPKDSTADSHPDFEITPEQDRKAQQHPSKVDLKGYQQAQEQAAKEAQCIAADDPRLKSN